MEGSLALRARAKHVTVLNVPIRKAKTLLGFILSLSLGLSGCARGDLAAAQPKAMPGSARVGHVLDTAMLVDELLAEPEAQSRIEGQSRITEAPYAFAYAAPQHTPVDTVIARLLRARTGRVGANVALCDVRLDSTFRAMTPVAGEVFLLPNASPTRCVLPADSAVGTDSLLQSP